MKKLTLEMVVLLSLLFFHFPWMVKGQALSLDSCYYLASQHLPTQKSFKLITENKELEIDNLIYNHKSNFVDMNLLINIWNDFKDNKAEFNIVNRVISYLYKNPDKKKLTSKRVALSLLEHFYKSNF